MSIAQPLGWNRAAAAFLFLAGWIVLFAVAVVLAAMQRTPFITTARYVSSAGNDAASGDAPDRAWRTLAKVSQHTFGPGATIYLRRGDVWNDALVPRGHGDPARNVWITVKPYGDAAKAPPVIDREWAIDRDRHFAIKLVDVEGWRFEDLEIKNSRTGLVYLGTSETKRKSGLQVARLTFRNIRGLPDHQPKPEDDKRPYWWLRGSSAISITGYGYCKDGQPATDDNCAGDKSYYLGSYGAGLSDVLIEDVTIEDATYGIWIWAGGYSGGPSSNYRILRPRISRVGIGGLELTFLSQSSVDDPKIQYAGGDSCWSGTFGIDMNYAESVTITGGEVAYTLGEKFYEGEGTGVNLNGPNRGVRLSGMRLHNNDGPAIAIENGSAADKADYEFVGNDVVDNARKNDHPAPGQYEYSEFITVIHLGNTRAAIRDNRIKVKSNRHLITAVWVKDPFDPDVWKDQLTDNDRRLPEWTFCGNRDISATPQRLIAGNSACR